MARLIVEDFHKTELDQLEPQVVREIVKKCLWAGAKVVEKEMKNTIEQRHHVVHGYMRDSVSQTDVHEDLDRSYVDIYPQGTDPRGVSNELKNKIIINGYYNVVTGKSKRKKDNYINSLTKQITPRVLSVMEYQFNLCIEELKK